MRNEPITRVADLMGHSSPLVTLKVCAHWLRNSPTNGVGELARALCGDAHELDEADGAGSEREETGNEAEGK
jgi:hypothetical protein